jgi:hypothetical protein
MSIIDRLLSPFIQRQLDNRLKSFEVNGRKKVQASYGLEGGQNLYDITYGEFDNPYTQIDFTDSWVKFTEYRDIIYQTYLRYNKRAPFGAATVKTVVQFLAAWAVKDITVIGKTPEHTEFIELISKQVNLDKFVSELSTLSELQGHSVVDIRYTMIDGQPFFKWVLIPFRLYQYNLLFDTNLFYNGYTYKDKANSTVTIDKDKSQFFPVYGFDSDYISASYPIPSVGYILEHADTIDKARENIRHTNKYFAKKTPVISTEDQLSADKILDQIESRDWKLTSFLVAPHLDLKQIGADNEGVKVLIEEILTCQQAISGTCGVPIDKLGYPEQFSAQSVRLENSESINVQAAPKRVIYKQGLEELFAKTIKMYNVLMGKTLDPNGISITINESAISLQERKATMLNDAFDRGVIDQQYYLENHPLVSDDAEEILERIEEKKLEDEKRLTDKVNKALIEKEVKDE